MKFITQILQGVRVSNEVTGVGETRRAAAVLQWQLLGHFSWAGRLTRPAGNAMVWRAS
jgi:hypothetical protein